MEKLGGFLGQLGGPNRQLGRVHGSGEQKLSCRPTPIRSGHPGKSKAGNDGAMS